MSYRQQTEVVISDLQEVNPALHPKGKYVFTYDLATERRITVEAKNLDEALQKAKKKVEKAYGITGNFTPRAFIVGNAKLESVIRSISGNLRVNWYGWKHMSSNPAALTGYHPEDPSLTKYVLKDKLDLEW